MKKLIVILMIICIFSGCSKEEPHTPEPTKEPTTEPAKEATESTKISDDELIKAIYDEIDETQKSITNNNYDSMTSAANLSLADESVINELAQLGGGHIKMGPDGIVFDNIGPEMQKSLENILGNLSDLKFYQECTIRVNSDRTITREQVPGAKSLADREAEYLEYAKGELDKTCKDHYSITEDGYLITFKVWKDGYADIVASGTQEEYEAMKSEVDKLAKELDSKVFDYEVGCHTAFFLINDKDTERFLIYWVDGELRSEKR